MIETRQLITFQKTALFQSFSKAAQELGYTQSAVTIQIKQLEDDLNTHLFDRIGNVVTLTPQGKTFLDYANTILNNLRSARTAVSDTDLYGHWLHIGTIESLSAFKMPAIFDYFYNSHPEVSIKVTTSSPNHLIEMLERNQLDIVYLLDEPLFNNNWIKVLEKQEDIVFIASAASSIAKQKDLKIEQLLDRPFFLTEEKDNYRRCLDQFLASQHVSITPFLEIGNANMIIKMVMKDLGYSFLPYFTVSQAVKNKELSVLPISDFKLSMYQQVFYHKDKWVTEEMEEFISLVTKEDL